MSCGAETEAGTLMTTLLSGESFSTLPVVDLSSSLYKMPGDATSAMYGQLAKLTNADLTEATLTGNGSFDVLMRAIKAHLSEEYTKGRITGAEYSKAYIALVQSAMQTAVTYTLGKDQAYWQAVNLQAASIKARIDLEVVKTQLATAQYEVANQKASYALTKLKLSSESIQYCTAKYQLDNLLPAQLVLVKEQAETARAQTLGTRSDGVTVGGTLGKQTALYTQQIKSYANKDALDVVKLSTEAWTVQKTVDDATTPPAAFVNSEINIQMDNLRASTGLPTRVAT